MGICPIHSIMHFCQCACFYIGAGDKKSRYRKNTMSIEGTRKKYSRKFAFSSMCECGFCGKYLTRPTGIKEKEIDRYAVG